MAAITDITVDPIEALLAYLATFNNVQALVGNDLWGCDVPKKEAENMPKKSAVFRYAGIGNAAAGQADYSAHGTVRIDMWCYGENFYEASRVRRTLHPILKQIARVFQDNALIHSVTPTAGPIQFREPETDWAVIIMSYSVFYAEMATT